MRKRAVAENAGNACDQEEREQGPAESLHRPLALVKLLLALDLLKVRVLFRLGTHDRANVQKLSLFPLPRMSAGADLSVDVQCVRS